MRKITIIHPSRGRPTLCYKTANYFLENSSKNEIEYFVSIDESDPKKEEYLKNKPDFVKIIVGNTNSCIESLNFAANQINFSDILIVVSDDFTCQKDWDVRLRDSLGDEKDFVLKTSDGREPWIVTFPIMDKIYYQRYNYVYCPEYKHLFCDTEMTHVAEITGRLLIDQSLFFEHLATNVTHNDETNQKNSSTWWQGESVYLNRVRNNFNLPKEYIIANVSHPSHICWLEGKGVKMENIPNWLSSGRYEYMGCLTQQNPKAFDVFRKFFKENNNFDLVIEIGTGYGGFSMFLKDECDKINAKFITHELRQNALDHYASPGREFNSNAEFAKRNIEVRFGNIFEENNKQLLFNEINKSKRALILCDGGNKVAEFNMIAPKLRSGDVLMAHDYAPNHQVFHEKYNNKIWNWLEIVDSQIEEAKNSAGLENFYIEFNLVAWLCTKKK